MDEEKWSASIEGGKGKRDEKGKGGMVMEKERDIEGGNSERDEEREVNVDKGEEERNG